MVLGWRDDIQLPLILWLQIVCVCCDFWLTFFKWFSVLAKVFRHPLEFLCFFLKAINTSVWP